LDAAGGSLLTRWTHTSNGGAETTVAAYFDTYRRADLGTVEVRRAVDFDMQHHFASGGRHDIVAGAGYRVVHSYVRPSGSIGLLPPARTDPLYSAFAQDEIRLADAVWLTAGARVEHNAYTGIEFEPSVRIAWMPGPRSTLWAAAARAVRQPTADDTDVRLDLAVIPLVPGVVVTPILIGNPNFRSEDVRDFEAGYRSQWAHGISLDATAFLSYFEHLAAIQPLGVYTVVGPAGVRLVVPQTFSNGASARDYGAEILLSFRVFPRWRLTPGYSLLHVNVDLPAGLASMNSLSPRHLFQMRSSLGLSRRVEWEQQVVWQSDAPSATARQHTRVDARLTWRARESIEVSLVGQNLLARGIAEFVDVYAIVGGLSGRRVFGKVAWTF
jgi:iron complex outermembrane receptor protein